MKWGDLLLRARAIVWRGRAEQELDEELRSHLEFQARKHIAAGLNAEEARRRARVEFGVPELVKEKCRDERGVNMLDCFVQDLRYAVRGIRRDPMLSAAALLTLAVCIGANTTVFSLVNSIMRKPLPFPEPQRIYWIGERMGRDQSDGGIGADYYSLNDQNKVFTAIGAYDTTTVNWMGSEKAEQLDAAQVTPSFFKTLATEPLMGRYLMHGEEGTKAPSVAVVSYSFWRNRMGSDHKAVGRTIRLDGLPNTVVGIMPQGFDYPHGTQIWKPLKMDEASQRPRTVKRPMWLVRMIARLKPGIGRPQLDAEMARLTSTIRREYPKEFESAGFLERMAIAAIPLQRRMTGDLRPALLVLSGTVGLVLLIACANLANLLLARATARQRELAVRMALGSGRARIVRQVLTESIALALPGGAAGVAIAFLAVAALNAWKPTMLQSYPPIALDIPVLAFTAGLTLATGAIFGLAPAFTAAGISIQDALKSGGHMQSGGRRTTGLRHTLAIAELGVSLVLLIGAGLLARSFMKLAHTELGFTPQNLLTLRVNLAGSRYATGESQVRFYDGALERFKMLPMVREAAVSTDLPMSGEGSYSDVAFNVFGRIPLPIAQRPRAEITVVGRDFFRTLGVPLHGGRIFNADDTTKSAGNIVVNEAFAKNVFPGENPIGKQIYINEADRFRWTIIGTVGNIAGRELGGRPEHLIYRCLCQAVSPFHSRMSFLVRTAAAPQSAIRTVEAQLFAVDRSVPVFDVKTMEQRLTDSLAPARFHLLLIGVFAAIAMVLAAVGVYGVMSYLVALRTREIGIRLALGASFEDVLGLVLKESVALAVLAILAGIGSAWGLTRYLKSMLYGVAPLDGWTFATMPVLLAAIALSASLVPALKALRIDPTIALREE
jgi:putative ABC transport system permease protein